MTSARSPATPWWSPWAPGARDNAELEAALDAAGIPHCTVGDAERPRRALDAIREGFLAARED